MMESSPSPTQGSQNVKKQLNQLFVGIISAVAVIGMNEEPVLASSDSSTFEECSSQVEPGYAQCFSVVLENHAERAAIN